MMKDKVQIGKLDRKVTIVQLIHTITSTGASTQTDSTVATVWAQAVDVSGTEEADGKVFALSVRKYVIRYNSTIAANGNEMYVTDGAFRYDIHSIAVVPRKRFLILKCSQRE